MKEYIDQIFYEGLGKTLYYPIEKVIKKTKNKKLEKNLILTWKILYFLFSIVVAILLFKTRI